MRKTLTGAIGLVLLLAVSGKAWPDIINRIIAVVNDEIITQAEIDRKKTIMLNQASQLKGGPVQLSESEIKSLEQVVLDNSIVNKLVAQEAKRLGIEVADSEIDEMLNAVKKRFPSEDKFFAGLKEAELTLDDLRQSYENKILMRKMFFDKARKEIVITPKEIEEYYNRHKDKFTEQEKVKLRNIYIKKEGRSPEEISSKLEAIFSLLEEGGDFNELAKKFSEGMNAFTGGQMGEIKRGEFSANIENIIFDLKPGKFSEWIETGSGFYLFKVEERVAASPLEFDEAQEKARSVLFNNKMNDKLNDWINKLKDKAYIKIYE